MMYNGRVSKFWSLLLFKVNVVSESYPYSQVMGQRNGYGYAKVKCDE